MQNVKKKTNKKETVQQIDSEFGLCCMTNCCRWASDDRRHVFLIL